MARKSKNQDAPKQKTSFPNAYIAGSGIVAQEEITNTLVGNYMPYAMSVIVSRALPEIDGFKPSHRKLLYTMYKMGLLTGSRTKSANIVGQTMKLNPHGDAAIYETMVRLARGNEALLHPFVDSKGNFGKAYSKNMAYAASRYTEAKLDPICNELFRDIDKETVDFVPNYDNEMLEPTLLPATFPTVLVNNNTGIAVSMASNVCSFNLKEICETTIALIKDKNFDIHQTLKGPDFPGGGYMYYDEAELEKIYRTGRGSLKIKAKYNYDKSANCIEITEIPPTTTIEAIMDKVIELVKNNKLKEVSYIRDETDLGGLKIAIDIKKGVDPDALMKKLFRLTPLRDTFSCNFNILIVGTPKVMGVYEILEEWTAFRKECIKRRVFHDMTKKKDKYHLLKGLEKILMDIDTAIKIVRETEEESEVVPNLMIGFGIDEVQADYVAEIKLRHLNREYIINRIAEIEQLEKDIAEMEGILASDKKQLNIIVDELKDVIKKYSQPRKTMFYYEEEVESTIVEDDTPDFACSIFLTEGGYFKKILPNSLRMSAEQKYKEGDSLAVSEEVTNRTELLFFSDKGQVYKSRVSDFSETKASAMGDFIPAKLGFDEGENVLTVISTTDYSGWLMVTFDNGKVAKIPLSAYETKTNRKKLTGAYSTKANVVSIVAIKEDANILITSSNSRAMIYNTAMLLPKTSRETIGVQVLNVKVKSKVDGVYVLNDERFNELKKYAVKNIPSTGFIAKEDLSGEQISL